MSVLLYTTRILLLKYDYHYVLLSSMDIGAHMPRNQAHMAFRNATPSASWPSRSPHHFDRPPPLSTLPNDDPRAPHHPREAGGAPTSTTSARACGEGDATRVEHIATPRKPGVKIRPPPVSPHRGRHVEHLGVRTSRARQGDPTAAQGTLPRRVRPRHASSLNWAGCVQILVIKLGRHGTRKYLSRSSDAVLGALRLTIVQFRVLVPLKSKGGVESRVGCGR